MSKTKRKKILIIYTGGTIGMMKTRRGYTPQKEKFHQLLDAIPELKAEEMPDWERFSIAQTLLYSMIRYPFLQPFSFFGYLCKGYMLV